MIFFQLALIFEGKNHFYSLYPEERSFSVTSKEDIKKKPVCLNVVSFFLYHSMFNCDCPQSKVKHCCNVYAEKSKRQNNYDYKKHYSRKESNGIQYNCLWGLK